MPRMLALATARADGDTSVPEELRNYEARSRHGQAASPQAVIRISADWILPISDAAIGGGAVTIDDGRIVSVHARDGSEDVALGRVAVLPGLVNAHTHLELSYLHGRIPPASTLPRLGPSDACGSTRAPRPDDPSILRGRRGRDPARSRDRDRPHWRCDQHARCRSACCATAKMPACVFHELIGFAGLNADEQVAAARHGHRRDCQSATRRPARASRLTHPIRCRPRCLRRFDVTSTTMASAVSTVHLGESSGGSRVVEEGQRSLASTARRARCVE